MNKMNIYMNMNLSMNRNMNMNMNMDVNKKVKINASSLLNLYFDQINHLISSKLFIKLITSSLRIEDFRCLITSSVQSTLVQKKKNCRFIASTVM
jgi:hypothetical protein